MGQNIFFDTCVYHQPGIDLLTKVVPVDNILFASEMVGAVKGIDPQTGNYFDDTKRYVDGTSNLSSCRQAEGVRRQRPQVYPRLKAQIEKQARGTRRASHAQSVGWVERQRNPSFAVDVMGLRSDRAAFRRRLNPSYIRFYCCV